jgi:predicted ribosomally synthesized peptide with nif11-like leader
MSIEALVDLIKTDQEFQDQIKSAADIPSVISIADSVGITVSEAEIVKLFASTSQDLTDEQLEAVAGGSWTGNSGADYASSAAVGGAASAGATFGIALSMGIVIK